MKKTIGAELASEYERPMSKRSLGQYEDRVDQNAEVVSREVVETA